MNWQFKFSPWLIWKTSNRTTTTKTTFKNLQKKGYNKICEYSKCREKNLKYLIKEKGRISHCFDPILLNIITKQTTKDKSSEESIENLNNNQTVDKWKDGTSKLKSQEFGNLNNYQTVDKWKDGISKLKS